MAITLKVLVAEDNSVTRMRIAGHLSRWGYEHVLAEDGEAAWARFSEEVCPLVITDWEMPGMNGLQLIKKIREKHPPGDVYIITLTARSETEDVVEALQAGADDFLCKPFARSELRVRMQSGARIVSLNRDLRTANGNLERRNAFI